MKIVTFATKTDGYYQTFLESARRHDNDVVVLGWGEEWKGFGMRMISLLEYVKTLDPKEVVVFVDSYDVVFLRNLSRMEQEYINRCKENGEKIIISVEKRGLFNTILSLFFGSCRSRNLNAGTYVGYAYLIQDTLSRICKYGVCKDPESDDQRLLTRTCQQNPHLFDFDDHFKWFLVWGSLDNYITSRVKFQGSSLYYKNHLPYILHCPGDKDMHKIIGKLGYKSDYKQRTSNYLVNLVYNQGRYIVWQYYWVTILIILLVISTH